MVKLFAWSTTADNNNSASPNGFPESMAPSGVNNSAREMMALLKAWYEDAGWVQLHTATFGSGTTFTVATDVTTIYTSGRRFRSVDGGGTVYGTIVSSSYSNPTTTVTVLVDGGGTLTSAITRIELSIMTPQHSADISAQVAYNAQTGTTYTLAASDNGKIVTCSNAGAITVTLPQQSSVTLPQGFYCVVRQKGAGQVTLALEGSDTLQAPNGQATRAQYSDMFIDLPTAGSPNTWHVVGDTTT